MLKFPKLVAQWTAALVVSFCRKNGVQTSKLRAAHEKRIHEAQLCCDHRSQRVPSHHSDGICNVAHGIDRRIAAQPKSIDGSQEKHWAGLAPSGWGHCRASASRAACQVRRRAMARRRHISRYKRNQIGYSTAAHQVAQRRATLPHPSAKKDSRGSVDRNQQADPRSSAQDLPPFPIGTGMLVAWCAWSRLSAGASALASWRWN